MEDCGGSGEGDEGEAEHIEGENVRGGVRARESIQAYLHIRSDEVFVTCLTECA